MGEAAVIRVTVVHCPGARCVHERLLELAAGTTAVQALHASGLLEICPELSLDLAQLQVGVWGHKVRPEHLLRDRDRVEIYRPLRVDPKVARRERFRQQGSRSAGLFATRRRPQGTT